MGQAGAWGLGTAWAVGPEGHKPCGQQAEAAWCREGPRHSRQHAQRQSRWASAEGPPEGP